MRTIDIHAHLVPQCLWRAFDAGEAWHGIHHEPGPGAGFAVLAGFPGGRRVELGHPKIRFTPEERLQDMDADGVDLQVVSIHTPIFSYHLPPEQGRLMAREFNEEVAAMTRQWPDRFAGLVTLPAQDIDAAIDVLDHAVNHLGLKGAELDMVVNGRIPVDVVHDHVKAALENIHGHARAHGAQTDKSDFHIRLLFTFSEYMRAKTPLPCVYF